MAGFGGSWGSTLALAYAQAHPERVAQLVLRGIFLLRRWELAWFYQSGASRLFPDAWAHFVDGVPALERDDMLTAYYRRLRSDDPDVRLRAARRWSAWEAATSFLRPDVSFVKDHEEERLALAFARIESHYFHHHGFFEADGQLLLDAHRIRHIPCVIVHGRYDVVCPLQNAWDLQAVWPEAELVIAPSSGHSAFEPEIACALVEATDAYR